MKAIQKTEPKYGAEYMEISKPEIGENDLLIKVLAAAICKSDMNVYEWSRPGDAGGTSFPFTMGHEYCGEVIEVGKNVRGFINGDHVAGETHVPCGYCHTCRTGKQHICGNKMGIVGRSVSGCFAKYMRVPGVAAVKVDISMPAVHAALMEPLGVTLHALQVAEVSGKTVAVFGCGTIGRMAIELAKILGATKVLGISRSRKKMDDAPAHGADCVVDAGSADIVEAIKRETYGRGAEEDHR